MNYEVSIDGFWKYVEERNDVWIKRFQDNEVEINPIFNNIRIENVYRDLDKTTIYINEFIKKDITHLSLFQIFNNLNTWELLKQNNLITNLLDLELIENFIFKKYEERHPLFTNAYLNLQLVIFMKKRYITKTIPEIKEKFSTNLQEFYNNVKSIVNFGSFTAYQLILNAANIGLIENDFNFVKLGPGARKGLDILFNINSEKLSTSECLKYIFEIIEKKPEHIKKLNDKDNLEVIEYTPEVIENILCAFQKMTINSRNRNFKNSNNCTLSFNNDDFEKITKRKYEFI